MLAFEMTGWLNAYYDCSDDTQFMSKRYILRNLDMLLFWDGFYHSTTSMTILLGHLL